MALKIRLSRGGAKKKPFYRIVVAEALSPRDGKFIERLGSYNPMLEKESSDRIVLNTERIKYWVIHSIDLEYFFLWLFIQPKESVIFF